VFDYVPFPKFYMFRTVPVSIIRSFSLYTQQWYMSYRFAVSLRAGSGRNWFGSTAAGVQQQNQTSSVLIKLASCQQTCMTYTIALFIVKTPDDGHRNCPKRVEFYSKNKFENLVHLVGFIVRICIISKHNLIQKLNFGINKSLRELNLHTEFFSSFLILS